MQPLQLRGLNYPQSPIILSEKKGIISRPPVPHMKAEGKEDALSRRLRKFDNLEMTERHAGVYISTNETGLEASHLFYQTTPQISLGCHVGFSGWYNFDVMAARKSSRGIICDINPENAFFLHHILEIVKRSKGRFDFVDKAVDYVSGVDIIRLFVAGKDLTESISFMPNVSDDPIYKNTITPADEIRVELEKKGSWLNTDATFEHVRRLSLDDKLVLITEDIRTSEKFQEMSKILQDNGIQIDSLYLSNIHAYMHAEADQKLFLSTVKALTQNKTLIIATKHWKTIYDDALVQKVVQSKDIDDMEKWFFPPLKDFSLGLAHLNSRA